MDESRGLCPIFIEFGVYRSSIASIILRAISLGEEDQKLAKRVINLCILLSLNRLSMFVRIAPGLTTVTFKSVSKRSDSAKSSSNLFVAM